MTTSPTGSAAIVAGSRRALVLALGVLPFGMVYGVAVTQAGLSAAPGVLGSIAIFAGASQLSLVELHSQGAFWAVAVGTALVINARFLLYSAALAPSFASFPARWRFPLAHLMTDQAVTLSLIEFDTETDPQMRRSFYLGASLTLFAFWQFGTIVGITVGAQVPTGLQLDFIIPLMFTALVVPTLRDRPAVVAVIASVTVTILAAGLPAGTNILLGAVAGVGVGALLVDPDRPRDGAKTQPRRGSA